MSVSAPVRLASLLGLVAQVNANGSIRRMDHADVLINLFLANEFEGGPANLFLRRACRRPARRAGRSRGSPLLGPRSPSEVRLDEHGLEVTGGAPVRDFARDAVTLRSCPARVLMRF